MSIMKAALLILSSSYIRSIEMYGLVGDYSSVPIESVSVVFNDRFWFVFVIWNLFRYKVVFIGKKLMDDCSYLVVAVFVVCLYYCFTCSSYVLYSLRTTAASPTRVRDIFGARIIYFW